MIPGKIFLEQFGKSRSKRVEKSLKLTLTTFMLLKYPTMEISNKQVVLIIEAYRLLCSIAQTK
jgi:hypothetical protein